MSDKILTISIAAYNVEFVIADCLTSLVTSRYIDRLDIIVVDDGSKDNTKFKVEPFVNQYPQSVRYIAKVNGGHGSTINTAIHLAEGIYFKVIDGDDWVQAEQLDTLIEYLLSSSVDLVLTDYDEVYHTKSKHVQVLSELKRNTIYGLSALSNIEYLPMHAITVKLDTYLSCQENISEHRFYVDTEFVYFVLSTIKEFIILDTTVYQYRLDQPNQSVSSIGIFNHIEDLIYILERLIQIHSITTTDSLRNNVLFNLIQSRYKLLFYWFSIITDTSKDRMLTIFDLNIRNQYTDVYSHISIGKYNIVRWNYTLGLYIIRCIRKFVK